MSWPLSADEQYYLFEGDVRIPVDPETGAAILMLRPQGGVGVGIPAIASGDPGVHAEISETINFTELAHDDPTTASASFTTITPPTTEEPGEWQLNLTLHEGEPGQDGAAVLDPDDFVDVAPGRYPAVNAGSDAFELVSPKVGDTFYPATVNNSGTNDANSTLATIAIPAQDFDWRPRVEAVTVTDGTDVQVDLVARLNGETSGNVVARGFGILSSDRLTVTAARPAGSADGFNRVSAGAEATIYIRTERQSGSGTYTTSASTTLCGVKVDPIP